MTTQRIRHIVRGGAFIFTIDVECFFKGRHWPVDIEILAEDPTLPGAILVWHLLTDLFCSSTHTLLALSFPQVNKRLDQA